MLLYDCFVFIWFTLYLCQHTEFWIKFLKCITNLISPAPHFYHDFQEKYGPKGQGKNVTPGKPNKDGNKQKPEVDINVGLSERPPWFCRYILYWKYLLILILLQSLVSVFSLHSKCQSRCCVICFSLPWSTQPVWMGIRLLVLTPCI